MDVFNLQAKIGLDVRDYMTSLGNASDESNKFGLDIKGAFSASMKVGAAAIGAVVTETTALSAALVKGVGDLAEYGDHIDKQSQKMNMSAQAYQEWDAIMQHSGTSIDSMQMSMKTLANAVESGNDAFERLGITQEELQSLNNEQLFSRTITALQNVENETERTYLAGQLLGRGATELGALLNTSAEDTEKMRQRVHELNGVMSDEAVKASAAFQDSLQDMQTAMSGIKRTIGSELLPSFTLVMDGITEVFAGESGGENKIEKGINQAFEGIGRSTAKLKPIVSKLGNSLFTVIQSNLPQIVSKGIQFTTTIATDIISSIPQILSDAGGIIETIGGTISTNIPKIADAARQAITGFSGYLRENLPTIIPEGVSAVGEFVKGLTSPETTGTLLTAASDIIDGLINGLTSEETLNQIVTDAPIIVDNIVTGITNGVDKLADAALVIASNLLTYFKDEENRKKLEECGEKILDSVATGFTSLLGSGANFTYDLGGEIAKNIGLADYWTVGDKAFNDFWKGFSSDWEEFKTWFNLQWKDLLSPTSSLKSVVDSASGKVSDLILDREKETNAPFNYDELDTLPAYGPSPIPNEYRRKHGSLADRKHATGGIFTKPYYSRGDLFGENGREALLPLDNNTSWMDTLAEKLSKSNTGTIIQGNLVIQMEGSTISSDYDTDRFIERVATKLADLNILQNRSIGGTGYNG